jgi:hypothetical protein
MFKLFRKKQSVKPDSGQDDQSDSDAVPKIYQYHSREDWLSDWVQFRIEQLKRQGRSVYNLPKGEALPLLGSIGFDSAMMSDGSVWTWDEGSGPAQAQETEYKIAGEKERLMVLVGAQSRIYPELMAILPIRPQDATDCAVCGGTGYAYQQGEVNVVCRDCGCMGWVER